MQLRTKTKNFFQVVTAEDVEAATIGATEAAGEVSTSDTTTMNGEVVAAVEAEATAAEISPEVIPTLACVGTAESLTEDLHRHKTSKSQQKVSFCL